MKQKKIAVIGGGASGMMAAITAARKGARVTVFEGNDRVGKKILATGNGKCNYSNRDMDETHFYATDLNFVKKVLSDFSVEDTEQFFAELGMLTFDREGYLYPASEQAATVLDVLRMTLDKLGIRVVTECKIRKIIKTENHSFLINKENFDRVILTCGSKASPKTGSDGSGYELAKALGHKITKVVPALVQLCVKENLKSVSGVRAKTKVTLFVDGKNAGTESGELQLTDYGISGIVVFQLSRLAAYALGENKKVKVSVDFFKDYTDAQYKQFAENRLETLKDRTVEQFFTGMLNKKLMLYFIKEAGLTPDMPVFKADRKKLEHVFSLCRNWTLTVKEPKGFDNAQVCAGGVPLLEIKETMESKICPGLYFAGELLDVDGKCGGYNLQWAWSSGHQAGYFAAISEK